MANNKRIAYYDILNVISCFGVVCLHSNGYIHTFNKDNWWWLRVLVEVLFYFAVPVFFMLSGATLMTYRKRYSTTQFVHKRFLRVVFPYIFWGCVFTCLYLYFNGSSDMGINEIVVRFTQGKIPYTNYWFFIPLFLLYILIPFLSIMVVRLSYKQTTCLLVIMILFQSLLPTLYSVLGLEYGLSLPLGGYFLYALLGYYIATFDIEKNKFVCYAIYLVAVISLCVRYWLLYIADAKEPMLFTYFGTYAVFPSIAIFLFFKRTVGSGNRVSKVFTYLSKRSYGIFLLHTFLIVLLSNLISKQNPAFIPISAISVYFVSLGLVILMQKGRITRYIVP